MKHFSLFSLFLLIFTANIKHLKAQDVYANQLISNSSDVQFPGRITDTNHVNYAYVSNLLTLLSTTYVDVRFPENGTSGDGIHFVVSTTSQILNLSLLNNTTITLYDSIGSIVKTVSGNGLLQLNLLSQGTGLYRISYNTGITENYTFRRAKIEFNNLLSINLLSDFRIYSVFFQKSCPPIYATGVFAYSTGLSGVSNPNNAVNSNINQYATLNVPLNLIGLLPPSYLDLTFPDYGKSGDYVGFIVSEGASLLQLSLLQNIEIEIYDHTNTLRETKSGFDILDLKLLNGSSDKFMLGFVTQPSTGYNIFRARIKLSAVIGLLQSIRVHAGVHFAVTRPPVSVTVNGNLPVCEGDTITLTANDSLGYTNFVWNTNQAAQTIAVWQSGTYYVSVTNSLGCTRSSVPIAIDFSPLPKPIIVGDTVLCKGANGSLSTSIPYSSYLWSDNSTQNNMQIYNEGIKYVVVTDSNGCEGADSVLVSTHSLNISPTILPSNCSNINSGSISLNVTGGSGVYNYVWSNGASSANLNNLSPNLYIATINDSLYGCTYNESYSVTANNTMSIKFSVVNTSDCGMQDGVITATVAGGSGNYNYSWSGYASNNSAVLNNVGAGIYILSVSDNTTGCQMQDTIWVNDGNSILNIIPNVTPASCNAANGSVVVTVNGGSGQYKFLWSTGDTLSTISNKNAGTYYVQVTDNQTNCSKVAKVVIGQNNSLVITENKTAPSCNGASNGIISVSISGGGGNYQYLWSNGKTTNTIQNLTAGIYQVKVTDNSTGCSAVKTITLNEVGGPNATLDVSNTACSTNNNGAISINISGNNYSYLWSNGSTAKNQSNLNPGIYSVVITDTITKCKSVYSVTIEVEEQISLFANVTSNTNCVSSPNGSVNIEVYGGLQPFSYLWSNNATVKDLNNLGAGSYTLNVSDSAGCTSSITVTINNDSNNLLSVSQDTIIHATCSNAANGSITTNVNGGVAPYSYLWSNNDTTQHLQNVVPGTYTLTVTDSVGCTATLTAAINIDSLNGLIVSEDVITHATCSNAANGSVTTNINGGVAPYSYLWSNNDTTQHLQNVVPGTYTLTVTDSVGCTSILNTTIGIDSTNAITVTTVSVKDAVCNGTLNGEILVNVTGGVQPFTYSWSNGANTANLTNVEAGAYTLTVTDSVGCTATHSETIATDNSNPLVITIDSVLNTTCSNSSSGAVYVTVSGGETPYQYLWSNNENTEDLTGLVVDSYTLTVTDNIGCVATASATVSSFEIPVINGIVEDVKCFNGNDGAITITVEPTSGDYTYSWNNGSQQPNISSLSVGAYTVTVVDLNTDCIVSGTFEVNQPDSINISATIINDTCITNDPSGEIQLDVTGGTPPYNYEWSNGSTLSTIVGLSTGEYSVTVKDNHDCEAEWSGNVMLLDCSFEIIVYNAITPNGDGYNDTWHIEGIQYYPNSELKVFDKLGNLLYEQKGYNNDWNGTGMNGTILPDGTYFYIIKLNEANKSGGKNEFTGSLLIQR